MNEWGKTLTTDYTDIRTYPCNLWLVCVWNYSLLSGLLKPKSANSPREAMPPPASDE